MISLPPSLLGPTLAAADTSTNAALQIESVNDYSKLENAAMGVAPWSLLIVVCLSIMLIFLVLTKRQQYEQRAPYTLVRVQVATDDVDTRNDTSKGGYGSI